MLDHKHISVKHEWKSNSKIHFRNFISCKWVWGCENLRKRWGVLEISSRLFEIPNFPNQWSICRIMSQNKHSSSKSLQLSFIRNRYEIRPESDSWKSYEFSICISRCSIFKWMVETPSEQYASLLNDSLGMLELRLKSKITSTFQWWVDRKVQEKRYQRDIQFD